MPILSTLKNYVSLNIIYFLKGLGQYKALGTYYSQYLTT